MACRGTTEGPHYIHDFLLGSSFFKECQSALQIELATCAEVGIPVATDKIEGPSTQIVFLGIEIDTGASELRLPPDQLVRIRNELQQWLQHRSCTKRDLLSLIGTLQHASSVVRPGRAFLRLIINLSKWPITFIVTSASTAAFALTVSSGFPLWKGAMATVMYLQCSGR